MKARPVVFGRRAIASHPAAREILADRERRREARSLIARDPAMALDEIAVLSPVLLDRAAERIVVLPHRPA